MKPVIGPIICLLFTATVVFSCHKTDQPAPVTPGRPARFEVLLQPYMTGAALDSAVVETEINGNKHSIQLQHTGDTLYCPIDSIPAGDLKIAVTIYPAKLVASRRLLWTTGQLTISNNRKSMLSYKGPDSFTDAQWLPRLFIPDPVLNLTFIAGLRPSDSYFVLKNINPAFVDIEVYKEFFKTKGGVSQVAGKSFACMYCPIVNKTIENEVAFAGIPQQIGPKQWDHIEISASFGDGDYRHGWWVLTFNFTLPD
jgi:hypothetical protein